MASFQFIASEIDSNNPIPPPCLKAMELAKGSYGKGDVNGAVTWINFAFGPLLTIKGLPTVLLGRDGNLDFINAVLVDADNIETGNVNIDLHILKTCCVYFDQECKALSNISGIFYCSIVLIHMKEQSTSEYKGFPLDKMLHMRAILYSQISIFKQVRVDMKDAVRNLFQRRGTNEEMLADYERYKDPIYKRKKSICTLCVTGRQKAGTAKVVAGRTIAAQHANASTGKMNTKNVAACYNNALPWQKIASDPLLTMKGVPS